MPLPAPFRLALPLALPTALIVPLISAALSTGSGCGPSEAVFWVCENPLTGKDDGTIYDAEHFVNGEADPCHCYDPCGPSKACPIVVDAGPTPLGCDGGTTWP